MTDAWQLVKDTYPPPYRRYRVIRADGEEFHATPCYGMHHPWWVPRNAFTKEESEPVQMLEDDMWTPALEG